MLLGNHKTFPSPVAFQLYWTSASQSMRGKGPSFSLPHHEQ